MLNFFQMDTNSHLKRAMILLREANLARIEHQAAAEHHAALAQMYAERAVRLEREVYGSEPLPLRNPAPIETVQDEKAVLYAFDASRRLDAKN